MTKAVTKKPKAPANKYHDVTFSIEQMPGCCGIGIIYSFEQDNTGVTWEYSGWNSRRVNHPPKYATREQQVEGLYKEILKNTWPDKTGNYVEDPYSQLMISLVSSYDRGYAVDGPDKNKVEQYPELEELLIREGWTIYSVFINPNHKNEVTLYGKYFPERDIHPDDREVEEEVDEEDEVPF